MNSSPGRRSRRRDGKGKIVNLERKYFSLAAWQRDSLTMQLSLSLYSVNDQTGWKIILKLQLPLFWMWMFFTLLCIFHLSLFQNVTTDNRRGSQNEIACGTNFHFFFEREKTFEKCPHSLTLHLFLLSSFVPFQRSLSSLRGFTGRRSSYKVTFLTK